MKVRWPETSVKERKREGERKDIEKDIREYTDE